MRFFSTLTLLLATFISAAPVLVERGTPCSTILSDITTLDNNVKTLTTALKGYTGGIFGPIQFMSIAATFEAVHTSNRKAYSDAQSLSSQFSLADSTSIITLVQKTLVVDNPAAVAVVKAKKPLFAQNLLSGLMSSSLSTLLDDHVTLSAALMKWVAPGEVAAAQQAIDTITASLQDGINYYS